MKREYLGWIVAGAVIVMFCTLGAMQPQGQVGRYQLFQGRYLTAAVGGTAESSENIFRIDTQTGDVQQFISVFEKGVGFKTLWGVVIKDPSRP